MRKTPLIDKWASRRADKLFVPAFIALALSFSSKSYAADSIVSRSKIIENSMMVGIGATDILDTYLSQEKYKGTEVRFISHTTRSRENSNWSQLAIHQGYAAIADNRSGNGGEIEGMYNFQFGCLYNWKLCQNRLSIAAGATADALAGFLYNHHGGNNPAQARLQLNITPTARASWQSHISKIPVKATYEVGIPLIGLMFSPNYGQSYYEIFSRGDYDHNVVVTTPFSSPSIRQMLTLDATFGKTTLRIGYLNDVRQADVNSLKWHSYTHSIIIGITRKFQITKLRP